MNNNNRRPGGLGAQARDASKKATSPAPERRGAQQERRNVAAQPQRPGLHKELRNEAKEAERRNINRRDPRVPQPDPQMRRAPDPRIPRQEPRMQQRLDPRMQQRQDPRMHQHAHVNQSHSGTGFLDVLGMGIAAVVNAASEAKEQEFIKEQAMLQREMEEKKAQEELLSRIPSICPHCGAPTNRKLNCEYCDSYLVNSTEK